MNKTAFVALMNLRLLETELNFGDFYIFKVDQGPEAVKWSRRLHTKDVPSCVLQKEYPNYEIEDDDITGSDYIAKDLDQLLFLFRLYKPGDLKLQIT